MKAQENKFKVGQEVLVKVIVKGIQMKRGVKLGRETLEYKVGKELGSDSLFDCITVEERNIKEITS